MTEQAGRLLTERFMAETTGTRVEYKILLPSTAPASRPLPLILHLHGAMSSAASLEAARPAYERAWAAGELPPAIIACASTPTAGGFYIDHPGGSMWESLVGIELPRVIGRLHTLTTKRRQSASRWAATAR